jgi:hypothetical protein
MRRKKDRTARKTVRAKDWQELPDEEILQMRVRDLAVQIPGSALEPFVQRLYEELDAKGIQFHPPCYLADEWLCPDKDPIIGIPFCLAHQRLRSIEQKMMLEVEGGTEESSMKLLRHECGHALNYAYQLYRRTRWRELFGPFSTRYLDAYYYQPYSRRFVTHLEDNYAQAHPDEDFAETFAVWLAPGSRWEEKYRGWPVIKKLRYVDRLMRQIRGKPPGAKFPQNPPWSASRMTSTLAAHYERKRRALGSEFQGFYDDSLKELFSAKPGTDSPVRASRLLRQHRRGIINSVTRWTGHRKYDIYQLVNKFMHRCDALGLYAGTGETDYIVAVTALLTAIASNTLRVAAEGQR